MVHKVRATLGGPSLLPSWRQLASSRAGSTRVHHRRRICCTGGCCLLLLKGRGVSTSPVFWQRPVLMSLSLHRRCCFLIPVLGSSCASRPIPACCPGVVVDVIGPPKIILTPFPASRQASLSILKGAQGTALATMAGTLTRRWPSPSTTSTSGARRGTARLRHTSSSYREVHLVWRVGGPIRPGHGGGRSLSCSVVGYGRTLRC